jgi:signal transduction histidine kinase/CheY-like chemotaxis protein/HPt (histidine-containing phosphotransfer) domain-containing protein
MLRFVLHLRPYSAAMLACAVIVLLLGAHLWHGTKKDLSRSFSLCLGSLFVWSVFKFVQCVIASPDGQLEAVAMQWLGIAYLPGFFYIVARALDKRPLRGLALASVFIPGSIVVLLVFTNNIHHFFWADYSPSGAFLNPPRAPGFWLFIAYMYLKNGLSLVIMVKVTLRSRGLSRRWMRRIFAFFVFPVLVNSVFILFFLDKTIYDPTPIAYALTAFLMGLTLRRFDLFEAVPFAKDVILESIDSPFFVVDEEGFIVGANKEAMRVSESGDSLEGRPIAEIAPVLAGEIKAGDRKVWSFRGIEYLISCYNLKQASKEWSAKIFLFRDISELARAKRETDEARARAEAANAAKSAFIATVSHELRNPLNAIIGLVDLNLRSNPPPGMREDLEVIHSSGNIILGLVNDLLDLSKIEAGRMELEDADFDLHEKIQSVVRAFRPVAGKKGLFLDLEIEKGTPRYVKGDSLRYGQVLMNLVSNAIKFTEHGAVTVDVGPVRDEGPSGESGQRVSRVITTVRDTGIGISPAGLPMLFKDFSQVDPGISRRFGGTGLGLSICKKLVDLAGGEIRVDSVEGEGSVFSFTARFGVSRVAEAAVLPESVGPIEWRSLLVLVVDDDLVNLTVAKRYIQRLDHEVLCAQTGAEALEIVAEQGPDLVLLDMNLTDMDGFEVSRRIRAEGGRGSGAEPHIAAMTARADPNLRVDCASAGMIGCLRKPIDPVGLQDLLKLVSAKLGELGPRAASSVRTREVAEAPTAAPTESAHPEAPLVDMPALLEHLGDEDDAFARELLGILVEEAPEKREAFHRAMNERDIEAMQKLAHALKGSALTLCALPLAAAAATLETECIAAGQEGLLPSDPTAFRKLEALAADLEEVFNKTIVAAAAILGRDSPG